MKGLTVKLLSPIKFLSIVLIACVLLLAFASPVAAQAIGPAPAEEPSPFGWQLLQAVLLAVLPVLAVYGVKALAEIWITFKATQPDKADELRRAAYIAVKAAEQLGATDYLIDKKEWALAYADEWLRAKGIRISVTLLEGAIEAAVYEEFNRYKEEAPDPDPDPAPSPTVSTETPPAVETPTFPG